MFKILSKKNHSKKRPKGDNAHWEGKYFCDCRVRNIRKWLGIKFYGWKEE